MGIGKWEEGKQFEKIAFQTQKSMKILGIEFTNNTEETAKINAKYLHNKKENVFKQQRGNLQYPKEYYS